MPVNVGDLFRHFRVIEKAGEGGMGVVYRAHDTKLGRDVALKFLIHATDPDSKYRERLRREAKSLASLNHPNIVTIHDIGEDDGVPFLVLEWIAGKPLSDPSFPRPLPVWQFLRVAGPVADALGSAHERGIIHRDIKPGNVLVSGDGRAKLVDFGLAKSHDAEQDLTRAQMVVGTIPYMSPEQINGCELTAASDVFSFGVLAYELLAGRRPFRGDGTGAVIAAISTGRYTPLPELRKDLPSGLVAIIHRCLEKEPNARYQNAGELSRALEQLSPSGAPEAIDQAPTLTQHAARLRPRTWEQDIRFCTTADGMRIAYSVVGSGPVLVRVLGHFTHLEMEWQWADLRLFWEHLAERHTVVRYDGRGIGLSDRYEGDFTEQTRQLDLDAVLSAVGASQAILLGISEGGWSAATYAVQHSGRVSHLILYGAYARGASARPGYDPEEDRALVTLIRKGWGRDNPAFRQVVTSQFFRGNADPRLIAHFNEMQRASADPETAARYQESCHARGDGRDLFRQVKTPTLVIHCQDDQVVGAEEGRLLASIIPGAQLVLLPSGTHYFPTDPEVVTKAAAAIDRFVHGSRSSSS